MSATLVIYAPVIHAGYLKLFRKYKGGDLYLVGRSLLNGLELYSKEIRAINTGEMKELIGKLGWFRSVSVLEKEDVKEIKPGSIVMANELVSRKLAEKFFTEKVIKLEKVFLRWDEASVNSKAKVKFDKESSGEFDRQIMGRARKLSDLSSDWWRHVGAVVVKGGKVIVEAHNTHVPSEHIPYAHGDPRDFIEAGELSFLATAMHSEQAIMAMAAKKGISLEGASIYVTVFPCPVCAKLIAYSGISKCYFYTGHASLDGESILRSRGVEIIKVND